MRRHTRLERTKKNFEVELDPKRGVGGDSLAVQLCMRAQVAPRRRKGGAVVGPHRPKRSQSVHEITGPAQPTLDLFTEGGAFNAVRGNRRKSLWDKEKKNGAGTGI